MTSSVWHHTAAKLLALLLSFCFIAAVMPTSAFAAAGNVSYADTASSGMSSYYNTYEWDVLRLTNKERMKNGVLPLTMTEKLQAVALTRKEELLKLYSHTRPDGTSCFTAFDDAGVSGSYMGENIAYGYSSPEEVVTGWINSPGHHENMINSNFTHMGAGYISDGTTEWVQSFVGDGGTVTGISVSAPMGLTFPVGTSIDDFGVAAVTEYNAGGTYICPLISEMCSGYDSSKAGTQSVTVSFGSVRTTITVILENTSGAYFSDVQRSNWYYAPVTAAVSAGLIAGKYSNSYGAADSLTWAETVTFAVRIHQFRNGETVYTDSDQTGLWYSIYFDYALKNGIISSAPTNPNAVIKRGDAATIFASALGTFSQFNAVSSNHFSDVPEGSTYYSAVYALASAGICDGKSSSEFGVSDDFVRSEVAAMVARMGGLVSPVSV